MNEMLWFVVKKSAQNTPWHFAPRAAFFLFLHRHTYRVARASYYLFFIYMALAFLIQIPSIGPNVGSDILYMVYAIYILILIFFMLTYRYLHVREKITDVFLRLILGKEVCSLLEQPLLVCPHGITQRTAAYHEFIGNNIYTQILKIEELPASGFSKPAEHLWQILPLALSYSVRKYERFFTLKISERFQIGTEIFKHHTASFKTQLERSELFEHIQTSNGSQPSDTVATPLPKTLRV